MIVSKIDFKFKSVIINLNCSQSQLGFHWVNLSPSSFLFSLTKDTTISGLTFLVNWALIHCGMSVIAPLKT